MSKEETIVEQVDMNLDDILGFPGADNVMLPKEEPKEVSKPNVFSKEKSATEFLDKMEEEEESPVATTPDAIKDSLDQILDEDIQADEEEELQPQKTVTPKTGAAVDVFKKLIENQLIYEFDDEKPIEDYTPEDFQALLETNLEEMRNELAQQFFDTLPDEFRLANQYFQNGGRDMKPLFKRLLQLHETHELDPTNDEDAEVIVRKHLTNTSYGTPEEIDEEIEKLKDREELSHKAAKFKVKLDALEKERIAADMAKQEQVKKQYQQAAQAYQASVYETLRAGELNGIKVDNKTRAVLYSGLTEPSYPSMNGRPTNLLGHLLEKYQWQEPNHGLLAEALWLLADPKSYKTKLMQQGKNMEAAETAKKLKLEQASKSGSTPVVEKEERSTKRIKPSNNFFRRF